MLDMEEDSFLGDKSKGSLLPVLFSETQEFCYWTKLLQLLTEEIKNEFKRH